ncbi:MAG: hypothetical protein AAES65_06055 [Candidatus Thiodiazotropha sp. (ex. Lucinoma kazani)]
MNKTITKVLWRLYFAIIALSFVALISFYAFFEIEELGVADIVDIIFMFVTLLGLYGFICRRKIIIKELWRLWLPFIVLWDIYLSAYGYIEEPIDLTSSNLVWAACAYVFLFVPGYVGLYIYGYRSAVLWSNSSNTVLKRDRADHATP